MNKAIIYVCLVFCISGIFLSSLLYDPLARAFTILASLVGIVVLFFSARSRDTQQALENQRLDEVRKGELIREIGANRFVLKVRGASGICIGLFFFILAGLVFWPSPQSIGPILGGSVSLLTGILFTITAFPRIGRPVLELSSSGITIPEYGRIPWSEVDGIDMMEHRYRGSILSHTLIFHVPGLDRYIIQFVAYQSFIFPFRSHVGQQQVRVMLRRTSERPNVILDLSRELLNRATGRNLGWSAVLTENENEAYRRIQNSLKVTGDLLQNAGKAAENKDFKAMEQFAGKLEAEQRQLEGKFANLRRTSDVRQRKQH
jgi:hypothetical protein